MIELIHLAGNIQVYADPEKVSSCKGCGEDIVWADTRKGKKMPIQKIDSKYYSHFVYCSYANEFRKKKLGGQHV